MRTRGLGNLWTMLPAAQARVRMRRRHCRGILLIDCLIYIALLGLILGLAFAAFFRTLEHTTRLERNVADIIRALQAGERWREDVRVTTQPALFLRNADELILRLPRPQGHIAYIVRENAVFREETPSGAREQVLSNVKTSEFHREQRRYVTSWRWELELKGNPEATRVRPMFSFLALATAESERKP